MSIFLGDLKENILRIYLRCMLDASICAYSLLSILRSSIPICFADWPNKKSHECGILSLVSPRILRSNTLICSLESLDQKLEKLGIVEVDGCMTYIEDQEAQNV